MTLLISPVTRRDRSAPVVLRLKSVADNSIGLIRSVLLEHYPAR